MDGEGRRRENLSGAGDGLCGRARGDVSGYEVPKNSRALPRSRESAECSPGQAADHGWRRGWARAALLGHVASTATGGKRITADALQGNQAVAGYRPIPVFSRRGRKRIDRNGSRHEVLAGV